MQLANKETAGALSSEQEISFRKMAFLAIRAALEHPKGMNVPVMDMYATFDINTEEDGSVRVIATQGTANSDFAQYSKGFVGRVDFRLSDQGVWEPTIVEVSSEHGSEHDESYFSISGSCKIVNNDTNITQFVLVCT